MRVARSFGIDFASLMSSPSLSPLSQYVTAGEETPKIRARSLRCRLRYFRAASRRSGRARPRQPSSGPLKIRGVDHVRPRKVSSAQARAKERGPGARALPATDHQGFWIRASFNCEARTRPFFLWLFGMADDHQGQRGHFVYILSYLRPRKVSSAQARAKERGPGARALPAMDHQGFWIRASFNCEARTRPFFLWLFGMRPVPGQPHQGGRAVTPQYDAARDQVSLCGRSGRRRPRRDRNRWRGALPKLTKP
jgi:hypothetical protein